MKKTLIAAAAAALVLTGCGDSDNGQTTPTAMPQPTLTPNVTPEPSAEPLPEPTVQEVACSQTLNGTPVSEADWQEIYVGLSPETADAVEGDLIWGQVTGRSATETKWINGQQEDRWDLGIVASNQPEGPFDTPVILITRDVDPNLPDLPAESFVQVVVSDVFAPASGAPFSDEFKRQFRFPNDPDRAVFAFVDQIKTCGAAPGQRTPTETPEPTAEPLPESPSDESQPSSAYPSEGWTSEQIVEFCAALPQRVDAYDMSGGLHPDTAEVYILQSSESLTEAGYHTGDFEMGFASGWSTLSPGGAWVCAWSDTNDDYWAWRDSAIFSTAESQPGAIFYGEGPS